MRHRLEGLCPGKGLTDNLFDRETQLTVEQPVDQPGNVLISGGRILDPSQNCDITGDLFISNGRITCISTELTGPPDGDYKVINAEGLIICPGFIDIHCHLRQPGFEEKETIATGTSAAAHGGFTTVCCMPNTSPPLDRKANVEYVKNIASSEGVVRVLPIGCITRSRAGNELADLGELSISGVIAFSDDGAPIENHKIMRRALEYSRESGLPIIDHCEDLSLSRGGVINSGTVSTRLGLKGIPAAAEENMVARDIELARETGGRIHIAHVSTSGSVELIRRARHAGVSITAEVTPHHLTLTEGSVLECGTNAMVNPPLRTEEDVAALVKGLNEGVIDIIATDHAPHTCRDKAQDLTTAAAGISGLETAFSSLMSLVHRGQIDLVTLISKLTCEPARFLKRDDIGTFKKGASADITIIDPREEWTVNPDNFASKGKNTPLAGRILKGRVILTIYRGKVVFTAGITTNN